MNKTSTSSSAKSLIDLKHITLVGLMAAVICILAPISFRIPISPVAISLGTLAIYFVISVLGMKLGTLSIVIYILLGLAGLPVFSGFLGGPGVLFGPTGGYILGYIFMALICGFFVDKWGGNILLHILGMILGTIVLYLFGTLWLAYQASYTFWQALAAGVLPYIPLDSIKLVLGVLIGRQLRSRLRMAGLLPKPATSTKSATIA